MNNILTSAVNDKIDGASNDSIIVAPQFFSTKYNSGVRLRMGSRENVGRMPYLRLDLLLPLSCSNTLTVSWDGAMSMLGRLETPLHTLTGPL